MGQTAFPQPQPSSSSLASASSSGSLGPALTYPRPTLESIISTSKHLERLNDKDRIAWCQDVIRVLERTHPPDQQSPRISRDLQSLLNIAISIIISLTSHSDSSISALASYLKAKLLSSAVCPDYLPKDQRQAFKEFEIAARGGEIRGWFRLGREYEGVGDISRAKECFERGMRKGDGECTYVSRSHFRR